MARPILRASLPITDEVAGYEPMDAAERAETHRLLSGRAEGWPVRLTRCGEYPGKYGDNVGKFRPVAVGGSETAQERSEAGGQQWTPDTARRALSGEASGQ